MSSSDPSSLKRQKIVVCRDLGPDVMPSLTERPGFEVVLWPEHKKADRRWILDNVPGAAGIVVVLTDQVNDELLDRAGPSLKVVSTMSVGHEHVSLPALGKRGIRLGYTPDVLTDAVADTCIMLVLMASRLAKESMALVHDGKWPDWQPFGCCGPQLSSSLLPKIESAKNYPEKIVGFLGFGRIAQATLARLIPFGLRRFIYTGNPTASVIAANLTEERDEKLITKHSLAPGAIARVSITELATQSDIVFVLAPGGPATYHIIGKEFLSNMKPSAILVNAARGTLVHSDALADALQRGEIAAAGLDVLEGEPRISADNPLVKEPRCVIVPHIGSATDETRNGMAALAAQNVIKGILGEAMPAELNLKSKL